MESEKRKRVDDDGEVDGKREKGGDHDHIINGRESTVAVEEEEEEEVEKFFEILKRIQVAVKYFEKGNGSGSSRKVRGSSEWRPSFLLQDFEGENDDVKSEGRLVEQVEDVMERNSGLDLNSEPVSKDENTD